MANPAWVTATNVKFNGSLDNAVVLKNTGTVKSLILWDNLSTADKATLIDAVNKFGGTTPLAAPTSGYVVADFGGKVLGASATGLSNASTATAGVATVNIGGAGLTPSNASGLSTSGNTAAYQDANFAIGTTSTTPTNFTSLTAGHQAAHFTVAPVGGNASGLAADTPATHGHQNAHFTVAPTGGAASGLAADTPATHGHATIGFTATPTVTPTTALGIAGGDYVFTANIDGAGAVDHTVTATGSDTMTTMAALMQAAVGGSNTVAASGTGWVITSGTTGATSTVAITIPASSGTDLVGAINTALTATNSNVSVGGANTVVHTYTASVLVDGTHTQAISVVGTVGSGDTFTGVLAQITTGLAGFATAAIVGNDIVITSATTGTGSTVAITDTTLFAALASFASITTAAPGVNLIVHTYTASVLIDGVHTQALSVAGTVGTGDTFTNVLATITTGLAGFGTVAINGNDIVITSATTGVTSTVAITAGTLFPALTGYSALLTAVPGTGAVVALTATITINGTPHAFSALPGTMTTFADVVTALGTAIGGAGSVAMVSTRENTLTSNVITGGSGYTDGTYDGGNQAGVPLSGGTGVGALANITVSGGAVTAIAFTSSGQGYTSGDVLTALTSDLGGTGSGFSFTVTATAARGPDIKITSTLTGNAASVSIVDGTLFSSLPGFVEILPAHAGVTKSKTYNAVVTVDGAVYEMSETALTGDTYQHVVDGLNSVLTSHATAAFNGSGNITITSATTGNTSTVAVADSGELFSSLTGYVGIATVGGTSPTTYTATVTIDGVAYPISATGNTMQTFTTLVSVIDTAIGAGGACGIILTDKITGLGTITGGTLYTPASGSVTYTDVPLTTDSTAGVLATADITVTDGSVASVVIKNPGQLYAVGDNMTVSAANVGGTGSGFTVPVTSVNSNILISSDSTGGTSTVSVVDGNLFKNVTGFVGFDAAIPGVGGNIATFGTIVAGTGYANGSYTNVTLNGGSGTGATANVTVAGNVVTAVTLVNAGTGYVALDSLTISDSVFGKRIASTNSLVGGSGYVTGTYTSVPLNGGTGSGAVATIAVSGGAVTTVTITTAGVGYKVGDVLTAATGLIGAAGSGFSVNVATIAGTGFSIPVATIVTDLETEFFKSRAANGSKLTSLFNILYVGAKPAVPVFCPHNTAFRYYGGAGPAWRYLDNDATI